MALRLLPMLLCMSVLFLLSHQPGDPDAVALFPGQDKVAHGVAYALLGAAVLFAFSPDLRRRRPLTVLAWTMLVVLLFAISDEYHQSFIPYRDASVFDLVADAAGAALFCLFWYRRRSWAGGS